MPVVFTKYGARPLGGGGELVGLRSAGSSGKMIK